MHGTPASTAQLEEEVYQALERRKLLAIRDIAAIIGLSVKDTVLFLKTMERRGGVYGCSIGGRKHYALPRRPEVRYSNWKVE